jgi:hypothetical protein
MKEWNDGWKYERTKDGRMEDFHSPLSLSLKKYQKWHAQSFVILDQVSLHLFTYSKCLQGSMGIHCIDDDCTLTDDFFVLFCLA